MALDITRDFLAVLKQSNYVRVKRQHWWDDATLSPCTLRDYSSLLAKKDLVVGNPGMENGKV